ncbi:zinc finger protein 510 isoform X2 [Drosophila ficusphila]|uniref:zinc finger protein 510 isoform X2 n=1 Tax=Drosophila ficusphila TaxID=30025 RepID=UPI0007E881BA|nr:zinc finger protein 510 isoform X2 [Drosophila ficusphila]
MNAQCRLCGLYFCHPSPKILFESGILLQIKVLTGLSLYEMEDLPRHICPSCLKDLNISFKLRKQIIWTHEILMLRNKMEKNQEWETQFSNSDSKETCDLLRPQVSVKTENFYQKSENEESENNLNYSESSSPDFLSYLKCTNEYGHESEESDTYPKCYNITIERDPLNIDATDFDHLKANESNQESNDSEELLNFNITESPDLFKLNDQNFDLSSVDLANYSDQELETSDNFDLSSSDKLDPLYKDQEDHITFSDGDTEISNSQPNFDYKSIFQENDNEILSLSKYQKGFEKRDQLSSAPLSVPVSARFHKKGKKPLSETFSVAAENVITNNEFIEPKAKIIEIGTQLSLHKVELTIKKVTPPPKSVSAENIPPAKRRRNRKVTSLECTECGKCLKSTENLKMHILRHKGQKDFSCSYCDRQFVSKHLLNLHNRVRHLGEQPFKCTFCPSTFFTSSSKSRHEQVKHIRSRNFKCDECSSEFKTKSCLNKHKIIHTGKKPYLCDLCNKKFSRREKLTSHFKSQTHQKRATSLQNIEYCPHLDEIQNTVDVILTDVSETSI